MDTTTTKKIAEQLMGEHGLSDWRFGYDNAKSRFGCCHWLKKTITLSKSLVRLNDEARVRNTILHEIAHALTGRTNGHDKVWRQKAVSIGCDGERCYNSVLVKTVKRQYRGECPNCHKVIERHRRLKISCGICSNVFNPKYLIIWK
jgi:predicted SprT family Zn-dependent metalloprotease